MIRTACLAVALCASALPALAAAGPLVVTSKVLVEGRAKSADGTTRVTLDPAKRVVPGDRVVFVLAYRNTGARPIDNVVLDNPVPRGMAYRAPAQGSPAPDLSVDGKTYGPLATLRVSTPTGARPASADDVTHVRWRLARPLTAGAQGEFAFQAVLK